MKAPDKRLEPTRSARPVYSCASRRAAPAQRSPIQRRVLAGLCGEELRRERLDDTMLAEVPDALTHNLR